MNEPVEEFSYDYIIFKTNTNFLEEEMKKQLSDYATWFRFDRVVDAFQIDEKVSNKEIFDLLRKFVYNTFGRGYLSMFIKELDTLTDEEIKFLTCQLRCKVFNERHAEIMDFVPKELAEYLIKRITNIYQANLV
jgi:hypothetical protein